MLERAVLVLGLLVATWLVVLLARGLGRRRSAALRQTPLPVGLRERFASQGGGIVYVHGPRCAPCRQQAVILDRLEQQQGIAVVRVDASREGRLAAVLGVLTVPTTVIVDGAGVVRATNAGLRSAQVLVAQCQELAGGPARGV